MTASLPNRNIVISSIGTDGQQVIPVYINSGEEPTYRENGGDLRPGDIWFDSSMNIYYHYDGEKWIPTGGQKLFDIIIQDVQRINNIIITLQEENALTKQALLQIEQGQIDILRRLRDLEDNNAILRSLLDKMEEENNILLSRVRALETENTQIKTDITNLDDRVALLEGTSST